MLKETQLGFLYLEEMNDSHLNIFSAKDDISDRYCVLLVISYYGPFSCSGSPHKTVRILRQR